MDFKDYYKILEIHQTASLEEIKIAFKKQAVQWHPDRNLDMDTTEKMQEINEAYLILKDKEARERYDREYSRYKEFTSRHKETKSRQEQYSHRESESTERESQTETPNYEFDDEILKNWMRNARRQAVDLAKQTIREVGELSVTATKAASSKMLQLFVSYAIAGFILLIIFKACTG